jgi:hypothetical protein
LPFARENANNSGSFVETIQNYLDSGEESLVSFDPKKDDS